MGSIAVPQGKPFLCAVEGGGAGKMYVYAVCMRNFMTFWKGAPLFGLEELHPNGRKAFAHCKELAETFYPFVEEKGFYAWDINERIGLCRRADG